MQDYSDYRTQLKRSIGQMGRQMTGTMSAFGKLHEESMKPGALDAKQKEFIALGIAIADRCDGCIAFHAHEALAAGATQQELNECIEVAIVMGGGPSVMYGAHAYEAIKQFSEEERESRP